MMGTSTLLTLVLVVGPARALDSCCEKAAAAVGGEATVEWIPDPKARKPTNWDDEDDGPWEPPMIKKPLPGALEVFQRETFNSMNDAVPWLVLGLLSTGVFLGFCPSEEVIQRHLVGQEHVVVAKGAMLGLVTPLCSCGALPLALGMASRGATAPATVAFVVAAQSAGIDSFFFTVGMLGPVAAAVRMISAAAIATACGLAAPSLRSPIALQQTNPHESGDVMKRIVAGLHESFTVSLKEIGPSIVFGIVVTSALAAFLPPGGLAVAAALGGIRGRAAVLFLALPLNFCEHAAVPLAVALQKAGASGGLAFAVLATLPSINVSTLGVVGRVTGLPGAFRVAFVLWLTGLAGSFLADLAKFEVMQIGHGHAMLPGWYVYASKWILGAAVVVNVLQVFLSIIGCKQAAACCEEKACKS